MDSAPSPWRSASATAVRSTRSRLSGARGSMADSGLAMTVRFAPLLVRTVYDYGLRTAYEPDGGPTDAVQQPRSARRSMERPAPQDGRHRLDRVRRPGRP